MGPTTLDKEVINQKNPEFFSTANNEFHWNWGYIHNLTEPWVIDGPLLVCIGALMI